MGEGSGGGQCLNLLQARGPPASCCSSESVSPCAQGRSQFLPKLSLAGYKGAHFCRLDSAEDESLQSNLGWGQTGPRSRSYGWLLVAELTGQNSRPACFCVTPWVSQSSSLLASPTSVHPITQADIRSVLLGRGWQGQALSFLSARVLLRDPGCVVGCGWA